MFISIQTKIIALILVLLISTELIIVYFVYNNQKNNLISASDKSVYLNTETLFVSLRNMMLSGEASILVNTMADLKSIKEYKSVEIFKINGDLAFSDYDTLEFVNTYQDFMRFKETPRLTNTLTDEKQIKMNEREIEKVAASMVPTRINDTAAQELDYYTPITLMPECIQCHGDVNPVRGVIHYKMDVSNLYRQIDTTRFFLILFFSAISLFLLVVLFFLIRNLIIKPVRNIGAVVNKVGEGHFQARADIKSHDEFGDLGAKINAMTKGLEERFKLSKYVSTSTINQVQSEALGEENQRKNVIVLFSDVRGFTSYSENNPAETVIKNLNKVLQTQAELIHQYKGDIDKFVGDEIMAIFEDEYSAVSCAVAMIQGIIKMNKKEGLDFHIGIGINTGDVIMGHIGSDKRQEYAAIGDTVNVASRLCSLAKGDMVLITEPFYHKIKNRIVASLVTNQKIKGKKETLNIYIVKSVLTL